MFWCHPCGFAYCLECRTCGLACNHNIVNYSSELSSEFLPDSISSTQSPFDIGVLVDAVLAESSYFGATRSEHAQTRQDKFQDLITHLREGRSLGNTYLQSYARHGIEQFDYTGYIYSMPDGTRIPTLQEHYKLTPRIRRRFRFGDQKLILSTLMALTLRPKKFSVYWNSSDRVFSAKEQPKVLSSALRITSMNSRETHISLAF